MASTNLTPDQQSPLYDIPAMGEVDEFVSTKEGSELEEYIEDIAETVRMGLDQSISILTPWFFKHMPKIYYQTTPRSEKARHLSAIITGHVFETKQTVELWDRTRKKVTYVGPGTNRKIIIDMASKLKDLDLKMGSLYFSRDSLLFLSTFFRKGHRPWEKNNPHIKVKVEAAQKKLKKRFPQHKDSIANFLKNLDNDVVTYATSERICINYRMIQHMSSHEGAHTFVDRLPGIPAARLTLGIKGVGISEVLENVLHLIHRYGFDLTRAFVSYFEEGYPEPITVMHFVIVHNEKKELIENDIELIKLTKALRTLGWIDTDNYTLFTQKPYDFSINAANFLRSAASWTHILLGKENPYYYSEYKIFQTLSQNHNIAENLVSLFRLKFSPLEDDDMRQANYDQIRTEVARQASEVIDRVERSILYTCISFVDHTLKTNYFLPTKTGLAFRLDPAILDKEYYPESPYGIFFITGKDYRMFQVRWKDVARGGLRIVMPRNSTEHGYALSGLFDEVYGLSHAQQLKNKDIPEGGSKAVMVLQSGANKTRAVKGAINALLDLLVTEDESHEKSLFQQISYYPSEEIIYLGPDENMTNDLIVWVTEQAQRRGYQYANAFISSKPSGGINHKQYGVTSQGVHVFVNHVLKHLNLSDGKTFRVKMTGGPDGDVAGNELKILHKEYGEKARVVAIADGFGAAYDPEGLNWKEILRLVKTSQSIAHFNPEKLSSHSDSYVVEANTSEDIRKRNKLPLEAEADIFIPAGGRPYTVNNTNYKKLLDEDGVPNCRAIVEGANIFFTSEARQKLQEAGISMTCST